MKKLYKNIETGEVLTRSEMIDEAERRYEFDELMPMAELRDYYDEI